MTPLLIDISATDLDGPFAQFQATTISRDDMLRLVKTIGTHLNDERFDSALIEHSFDKWWPDFQKSVSDAMENTRQAVEEREKRPDRAIL